MVDKGDKLGRDVADSERWGIAPSFALGLGSGTRAYFNYLHVDQSNTPDGGLPAIGYPGYSLAALGSTVGSPVDTENFYGSRSDFDDVKVDMLTVQLEHDLTSSTTLRNVSRYGRTHQEFELTGVNALTIPNVANPATWTVTRSRQGKDQVNEILTNQTGLVTSFATGAVTHDLSSGIELLYERQSNVAFIASGTTTPPISTIRTPPARMCSRRSFRRAHTRRQDDDGRVLGSTRCISVSSGCLPPACGPSVTRRNHEPAGLDGDAADRDAAGCHGHLAQRQMGLVFKPVPFGSVYATVATSQLPPAAPTSRSTPAPQCHDRRREHQRPNLDPQKALNLESVRNGICWKTRSADRRVYGRPTRTIRRSGR